jgi:hypothetical protein
MLPLGSEMLNYAPSVVIFDLLSKWLDLTDVGRMDTSFSEPKLRVIYAEKLQDHNISFDVHSEWRGQSFVDWIANKQIRVHQLLLAGCKSIPDEMFSLCSRVTNIYLVDCPLLSDVSFSLLTSNSPNLKDLKITNCPLVSDTSFSALGLMPRGSFSQLESLSVFECGRVSDLGVQAFITQHGHSLKTLTLNNCRGITSRSLICGLITARNTLTVFQSEGCVLPSEVGAVLKVMANNTTPSSTSHRRHVVLTDVLLVHRDLVNNGSAISLMIESKPSMESLQQRTGLNLRMLVLEKEGVDDFAICVMSEELQDGDVQPQRSLEGHHAIENNANIGCYEHVPIVIGA